jgi:probable phosphoglycerate mutase
LAEPLLVEFGEGASILEPTRVIAIRHGETDWNVAGRMQGQLDIGLNASGRWQAERVAEALADERLGAIYTSDLRRACETAEPLARRHRLALRLEPGLRERCFGVYQGLTAAEVAARWPEASRRWRLRDPAFAPAGAESLQQFSWRCVTSAVRLAAAHPGETIALVTHGGVLDCLYRAATRLDLEAPRSWRLGNAGINRLLHTPGGFTLVGWSDGAHLDHTPGVEGDEIDPHETDARPPSSVALGCA